MSENSAVPSPTHTHSETIQPVSEARPETPPNKAPAIYPDILHTPTVRRVANYHDFAMTNVDIGKLRSALVQETRGHYIGGVEPHIFVENFMKWNSETDDAFKAEKPSKARLSRLIGMATKPESAMNTDWVSRGALTPLFANKTT